MAKKTWIKVSDSWKEVKKVWANVGGVWKPKVIPKGNIADSWKEFIQYEFNVYDYGTENVDLVLGYNAGSTNTLTKNTDHILLTFSGSSSNVRREYVDTNEKIDITQYKILNLEFKSINSSAVVMLGLTSQKGLDIFNSTPVAKYSGEALNKTVISLDISNYSGFYYLTFGMGTGSSSDVRYAFYRVWLE